MLDRHDDRTITALIPNVLVKLKENLAEHKAIYEEARMGYISHAIEELGKRAQLFMKGETPRLTFALSEPQHHIRDYEAVIMMLELHQASWTDRRLQGVHAAATYELKAADVRQYLLNQWDWSDQFLVANARYSATADALSKAL